MMGLESTDIWHRRMGHLHPAAMEIRRKSPGNGLDYTGTFSNCDVRLQQKLTSEISQAGKHQRCPQESIGDGSGKCRHLAPADGTSSSGSNGDPTEISRERPRLHCVIFELRCLCLQQKPTTEASQAGKHQNRHAHETSLLRPSWTPCTQNLAKISIRVHNHRPRDEEEESIPPSRQA